MTRQPPWLVVIDMQHAFGDPCSGWAAEGYAEIVPTIERLIACCTPRVVFTRFVRDPNEPGAWPAYYDRWASFRVAPEDPVWALTVPAAENTPIIDEPTFSKWTPALQHVVGDAPLLLCGVATECCVLSTAFGAADAGREVRVVADACAGATRNLHERALQIMNTCAPLITVATVDMLQYDQYPCR